MKGLLSVLVFVSIATSVTSSAAQDIPAHPEQLVFPSVEFDPPEPSQFRTTLSNGIVVYIAEDRELPLVNVNVLIRAGSAWEPAGKTGLASLVGVLMREGGTQARPPNELDDEIDFLAASIGTSIGATSGSASLNVLSKDIEHGLELLLDILRNPRFDEERLRIQRERIRQNLARRNDQTQDIESREWQFLMYGEEHFSSREITPETLSAISRDDLFAFHRQFVHPGNMMLIAAGDFDREEMLAALEQAFAGWEPGEPWDQTVPAPEHTPEPGIYMFHKEDVNQGRVSIGHHGIMEDNPDRFAIQVMNGILGGSGFTSRILSRVRSDEGLAYSAGSIFGSGLYFPATFRAYFQSRSDAVAYATRLVIDELKRMQQAPVTEEELRTEKSFILERFPRTFASKYQTVAVYAQDEFAGRDPERWLTYRDDIRSVTADDVRRVAQEYLDPENLVILIVGNLDEISNGDPRYSFSLEDIDGYQIQRFPLRDPLTLRFN